jgi:aminoglycoside/choline kinase family phosphotransferase
MEKEEIISAVKQLFRQYSEKPILMLSALPLSGSERRYFRITDTDNKRLIAVYNPNIYENEAFISFTAALKKANIKVPEIYSIDKKANIYLLEDLGDLNLLSQLEKERNASTEAFNKKIEQFYQKAIGDLIEIQLVGDKFIDYGHCYPTAVFDKKSMLADCHLFKYWYLFPTQSSFNEINLEKDFENLCTKLNNSSEFCFMFRDFQGRNIMIRNEELYYIDYQGGRKGPLQYDLASLLYQAKAAIPNEKREDLLNFYLQNLSGKIQVNENEFRERYYGFVLLRSLQVLGAYGFKGFYQQKKHFLESIPFAIENLNYLISNDKISYELPELKKIILEIIQNHKTTNPQKTVLNTETESLLIHIRSFAYKNGLPSDESEGHGQGYVFDCRVIHNPGRYEEYKNLNGRDKAVMDFFEKDGEMKLFLEPVYQIAEIAVSRYLERKFEYLGINFGCTGGQHRSVFAAEQMAEYLNNKFKGKIQIILQHREEANWPQY